MATEEHITRHHERFIPEEFNFLEKFISYRINKNIHQHAGISKPQIPALNKWNLPVREFVRENNLNENETIIVLLALAPHVLPDLLDAAIHQSMKNKEGQFPQLGGVRPEGRNFRGFLPTGETALFLLGDDDLTKRLEVQKLFWVDHFFGTKKVLWLEESTHGDPSMSGKIIMSRDHIETFIFGKPVPPPFSVNFPARRIKTDLIWDDLVISNELQEQVNELTTWIKYNTELMDNYSMRKRLKQGYRVLFYGPPGTGKTFTASLLGKYTGKEVEGKYLEKEVYKIDLSMVVSKYIGETEKNLELLFARAEDKGWILFFDEADALFGKRTSVRDAHDKYANQEVSYLLQRIEDYNGLIILATNMKNNIDDAFIRRFNAMLKFPFPDAAERTEIWINSFPENSLFLEEIVTGHEKNIEKKYLERKPFCDKLKKYELTGGNIINVIHYASLKAIERVHHEKNAITQKKENISGPSGNSNKFQGQLESKIEEPRFTIYLMDVSDGIKREMIKEGKPFQG